MGTWRDRTARRHVGAHPGHFTARSMNLSALERLSLLWQIDRQPSQGQLFWSRVERGHPLDCWPWMGYRLPSGYGILRWEGGKEYAHRVAWLISGRQLKSGLVIMHSCDNPPCCNQAHLRQGTSSDNTKDAIAKGRFKQHRNERQRQHSAFCKHGHSIAETGRYDSGHCRACNRKRNRRDYKRRSGKLNLSEPAQASA